MSGTQRSTGIGISSDRQPLVFHDKNGINREVSADFETKANKPKAKKRPSKTKRARAKKAAVKNA